MVKGFDLRFERISSGSMLKLYFLQSHIATKAIMTGTKINHKPIPCVNISLLQNRC